MKIENIHPKRTILIAGIFLVLIFIITALISKISIVDYSNTGQIGDTIGGITSPFVGVIGAVLVFLAFQAQIEANKIVYATRNLELIKEIIEQAHEYYNGRMKNIGGTKQDTDTILNMYVKDYDLRKQDESYVIESVVYLNFQLKFILSLISQKGFSSDELKLIAFYLNFPKSKLSYFIDHSKSISSEQPEIVDLKKTLIKMSDFLSKNFLK